MSDVKAFNNCMSVFWRQHEAEFSRFLTSKTGDSEKAADPEKTKVIIVTLAETTPVLEAANLQQDLRRAGIEPWAWVVNNSLAAAQPSSPFLKIRANRELPLISDVEEQYAKRIALTALQSEEPVGIDTARHEAVPSLRSGSGHTAGPAAGRVYQRGRRSRH